MGRTTDRVPAGARRAVVLTALAVVLLGTAGALAGLLPPQRGGQASVSVKARKYAFEPARIDVNEGDLVQVTLSSEDIPHSFTIDAYRIAKQARPGQAVRFEFLADKAGSFPFYCDLRIDDGCRHMRGELVVRPR